MRKIVTLIELQGILSESILAVTDKNLTEEERACEMATAASIQSIARNIIHNASTIMRAKEIIAEGKIKDVESVKILVGDAK